MTLLDGASALPVAVGPLLSVIDTIAGGGVTIAVSQAVGYDPSRNQLAVGRPASNIVTWLSFVEAVFVDGLE